MYFSIDTKILFNMFGIAYVILMIHAYVTLLRGLTLNIALMKVDNIFVVLWFPDFMNSRKVFVFIGWFIFLPLAQYNQGHNYWNQILSYTDA